MCDFHKTGAAVSWRGWAWAGTSDIAPTARGAWQDLTWPYAPGMPRLPQFPEPKITRIRSIAEGNHSNQSHIESWVHVGTHLDAPIHFVADAPAFEDVSPARLTGRGVVLRVDVGEYGEIDVADLASARPAVEEGDIVIIDAGWTDRFGDPSYFRHPWLTRAAAEWLVDKRIKVLGVDWPNPDAPDDKRGDDYQWPVHRTLLANGVLIAEHLTNVRALAGQRVEVVVGVINIVGGDGAPARVLARPAD